MAKQEEIKAEKLYKQGLKVELEYEVLEIIREFERTYNIKVEGVSFSPMLREGFRDGPWVESVNIVLE